MAAGRPNISSSMRPSHLSTSRQSEAECAALIFCRRLFTAIGGAHVFLCCFHPAFWHSAPQYWAVLQIEQRFIAASCFPQRVQQAALGAIARGSAARRGLAGMRGGAGPRALARERRGSAKFTPSFVGPL
jgi:hypothetical protein